MTEVKSSQNLDSIQTKYLARSPLLRYANRRFLETIRGFLSELDFAELLDAGCGEGVVLADLLDHGLVLDPKRVLGLDIDPARLNEAAQRLPAFGLQAGSLHQLPYANLSFDAVLCLEVLEHVGDAEKAVAELARVTNRYLLTSVPNEPWWRLANMLRGKYWSDWGNTPEHINHWTVAGFKRLIRAKFKIIDVRNPVLWTFILAEKK